jgi:succinoglycan biosynthesis protein ExoA
MLEYTHASEIGSLPAPEANGSRVSVSTPRVSVVIPCYNEERFIGRVLESLSQQYSAEQSEIIVVDGMSIDHTRDVLAQFVAAHPGLKIRLVDNPRRAIPAALNLGVSAAQGDVIVRMDAHSIPSPDYVRLAVELLRRPEVSVVGMTCRIRPGADTLTARAIALAAAHPFGIGDAKYRLAGSGTETEFVDTVPFGVFGKKLWQELGGFNEELLANEDYDFNYRVRQSGGGVLLANSGHCTYFARATFVALARQYFRYGLWKALMVKLHPRSIKLRQLAAPVFVLSLTGLTLLGWWLAPARWVLAAVIAAYTLLAFISALQLLRRDREVRLLPLIPVGFLLIHLGWGIGFLRGLLRAAPKKRGPPVENAS